MIAPPLRGGFDLLFGRPDDSLAGKCTRDMPIGNALGSEWCLLVSAQPRRTARLLADAQPQLLGGWPASWTMPWWGTGSQQITRKILGRNLKFRIELAELAGQHFWTLGGWSTADFWGAWLTLLDFPRLVEAATKHCRFLG